MRKPNYLRPWRYCWRSARSEGASRESPCAGFCSRNLDSWITNAEKHVVRVAEVIPADKYFVRSRGNKR